MYWKETTGIGFVFEFKIQCVDIKMFPSDVFWLQIRVSFSFLSFSSTTINCRSLKIESFKLFLILLKVLSPLKGVSFNFLERIENDTVWGSHDTFCFDSYTVYNLKMSNTFLNFAPMSRIYIFLRRCSHSDLLTTFHGFLPAIEMVPTSMTV